MQLSKILSFEVICSTFIRNCPLESVSLLRRKNHSISLDSQIQEIQKKMPKLLQNFHKSKHQIDLEPSKAWIKNLGAGTTKVMPNHRWNLKKSTMTFKAKYKQVKVNKCPAYISNKLTVISHKNRLYDSISTAYCMMAKNGRLKLSD